MKKLLSVIMVLILLFAACSKPEEPFAEQPENGKKESKLLPGGINPYDYDKVEDYGFMYVLTKTEGTRTGICFDDLISSIGEVPDEQTWLLLKNGKLINEEPFYDVRTYGGNINAPDEHWVTVCRDGARYSFYINEKTFEIYGEETILPSTEKIFDFNLETYYWISRYPSYGVKAADGTVICETHYSRLSIPFPDRIVAAAKASDVWSDSHCIIFDENGNTVNSSYNHIVFSVFEGGYIGIAYCADPETTFEIEFYQCYDKNGEPMPGGFWLIDKDGNPVSERFTEFYIGEEWNWTVERAEKDDVINVTTSDGEKLSFTVESVLIKE
ncbi:MAG: hypothetical protein IJO22_04625 [Oscillospiraceae bacterium]|nr:hypothetical protein [Oscillospiraceae bacterium]